MLLFRSIDVREISFTCHASVEVVMAMNFHELRAMAYDSLGVKKLKLSMDDGANYEFSKSRVS